MIARAYAQWIDRWETYLATRSTDRVVRPFEWGLDHASQWPIRPPAERNGCDEEAWLGLLNRLAIEDSASFYRHRTPNSFQVNGDWLTYPSNVQTPSLENNTVHARIFPGKKPQGRAVIVLPHWNSSPDQHVGLCQGIARFGPDAFRLSLPYHDQRMPPELGRADYAVSSNLARTIDSTRQAVLDIRCLTDWLEQQGYSRIGIVGTSLGSCYAFLASAHDPRLRVNVYNHCSSYVADVVWTGLSTRHILASIQDRLTLDRLRDAWQCISPVNFMGQYAAHAGKKSKFIYATYDTTFLPHLSEQILERVRAHRIPHELAKLPCGHYTLGETPFKYMDGYHIIAPLVRWL
jgi:dienelactone hydrolase